MSQTKLPFQTPLPDCVFCTATFEKVTTVEVKFVHLKDCNGAHYALINLPTCEEHRHVPTIHERGKGKKP